MNASFTEKKYESSYACIAASILGMRSKNERLPQNRSKKEAALRELLTVLVLFILTNNKKEEVSPQREDSVNEKRSLHSLFYDVSCVSVFICKWYSF